MKMKRMKMKRSHNTNICCASVTNSKQSFVLHSIYGVLRVPSNRLELWQCYSLINAKID